MVKFDEYRNKYKFIKMEREDGILQVTFHSKGGSLIWGMRPHEEISYALGDISRDFENKAVIITGAGENFCADALWGNVDKLTPSQFDRIHHDARFIIMNHLDIAVPTIAAFNGPALIHAELGLLCDIVLAAETATFRDLPHFPGGLVPGDGVHVIFPLLMGMNRARYFLLTGQELNAKQALDFGLVNEILPREQLLGRARTLARQIAQKPTLAVRYARQLLATQLRRLMIDNLQLGLALEGLAGGEHWITAKPC